MGPDVESVPIEKQVSMSDTDCSHATGSQYPHEEVGSHFSKEVGTTRLEVVLEDTFEEDAFSRQKGLKTDGDYLDFRTMGWFKAGLIATAEVSVSPAQRVMHITRTSRGRTRSSHTMG